ncbi:hypothetical protein KKC32_02195 [Patescibacteria group bacterium]|nr:hypothetical protein [Patescibacteria group bacterium]
MSTLIKSLERASNELWMAMRELHRELEELETGRNVWADMVKTNLSAYANITEHAVASYNKFVRELQSLKDQLILFHSLQDAIANVMKQVESRFTEVSEADANSDQAVGVAQEESTLLEVPSLVEITEVPATPEIDQPLEPEKPTEDDEISSVSVETLLASPHFVALDKYQKLLVLWGFIYGERIAPVADFTSFVVSKNIFSAEVRRSFISSWVAALARDTETNLMAKSELTADEQRNLPGGSKYAYQLTERGLAEFNRFMDLLK